MMSQTRAGVPEFKDGQALDRLSTEVEQWARSYSRLRDESRWDDDFESRFQPRAADLARRSTPAARSFEARDWILGVAVWALLGALVFVFSVFAMQLDATWQLVFAGFAVLVAAVGLWQSYLEVTSVKRAADKLARKEQWLLGVTRKRARQVLEQRAAG